MSEEVFRWVVAVGVLLACLASLWQAVLMAIIFRSAQRARQAGKDAQNKIGPLIQKVEAILTTSGRIVDENRPRISDITAETLMIAKTARHHVESISRLIDDAEQRAKARVAQIDQTVEQTVEQVEQATEAVKTVIMKPVREANGIVAGVKAALSTYARGGTRNSPDHVTQDEEMFI
jgi:hypothetical protein